MSLLGVKVMGEKFLRVGMKMEGVKVRQKLIQSLVRYLAVVLSRVMPCYFSRQVFFSWIFFFFFFFRKLLFFLVDDACHFRENFRDKLEAWFVMQRIWAEIVSELYSAMLFQRVLTIYWINILFPFRSDFSQVILKFWSRKEILLYCIFFYLSTCNDFIEWYKICVEVDSLLRNHISSRVKNWPIDDNPLFLRTLKTWKYEINYPCIWDILFYYTGITIFYNSDYSLIKIC